MKTKILFYPFLFWIRLSRSLPSRTNGMASPLLVTLLACAAGAKRGGVDKGKELKPPSAFSFSPNPFDACRAVYYTRKKRQKRRRRSFLTNHLLGQLLFARYIHLGTLLSYVLHLSLNRNDVVVIRPFKITWTIEKDHDMFNETTLVSCTYHIHCFFFLLNSRLWRLSRFWFCTSFSEVLLEALWLQFLFVDNFSKPEKWTNFG